MPAEDLFGKTLNPEEPGYVEDVVFDTHKLQVDIYMAFRTGAKFPCPECSVLCGIHDTRKGVWRHLNFFQYPAYVHANQPRVKCPQHGTRTTTSTLVQDQGQVQMARKYLEDNAIIEPNIEIILGGGADACGINLKDSGAVLVDIGKFVKDLDGLHRIVITSLTASADRRLFEGNSPHGSKGRFELLKGFSRRSSSSLLTILVLSIVLTLSAGLCQQHERIKMILTGRVSEGFLIRDFFLNEPLTDPLMIPSRELPGGYEQGRRYVRVYFPRSYQRVTEYDFVIFAGTDMLYFTQSQQRMIHDAIRDYGMGGLNSRSLLSGIYHPQWVSSVTQLAFPNDVDAVYLGLWWKPHTSMEIVLNEDPDLPPVLLMFKGKPIQWKLGDYDAMMVRPREGSTIWSWIKGPFVEVAMPKRGYSPHLISWKYGGGITWTCHDRLVNWWQDSDANPYGLDMIMNMVLYSSGRELPDDIEILHSIRRKFAEFKMRKLLITSTIDFGEKFGASMSKTEERLVMLNEQYHSAMHSYLLQEEMETLQILDTLMTNTKEANELATRELDTALMWVYIINWLVVTSTFMISGFILWTLMVKKRLYKEIKSTQLRGYRLEG